MKINRMRAFELLSFCLFLLLLITGCASKSAVPKNRVCFADQCVGVEVVDKKKDIAKGLMYRTSLEEGWGLFFTFEKPGKHNFWMKNMVFPLDIIWLNEEKKVIYIKKNALPCSEDPCESFGPDHFSQFVLEINAGVSDRMNIKIGDQAEFFL